MYCVLMLASRSSSRHPGEHEHHARAAIGILSDAHGRDVARLLGLDARGQVPKLLPAERAARELADLFLEPGAQPREIESGHLRPADSRAFGRLGLLRVRRHERQRQEHDEQSRIRMPGPIANDGPSANLLILNQFGVGGL